MTYRKFLKIKRGYLALPVAIVVALSGSLDAKELDPTAVDNFIAEMVSQHDFDRQSLHRIFRSAQRSERILQAMSRPAEKTKPWFEYRRIFLTQPRIAGGVRFWEQNEPSLSEATRVYGVPAEIIVAIIGVETSYGKITGSDKAIEALSTLAFHYPNNNAKRMHFFREQLRHLLLLCREQSLDPLSLTGSYAGAMGIPQFMPESYRKYAVDFNHDGESNIWQDRADAIGSVGNYLSAHGWQRGKSIVLAARVEGAAADKYLSASLKPHREISEFAQLGVESLDPASQNELAALFSLEEKRSTQYWLALNNFYVIMRYNPRTKYAMAVVKLAEAIRDARDA